MPQSAERRLSLFLLENLVPEVERRHEDRPETSAVKVRENNGHREREQPQRRRVIEAQGFRPSGEFP